MMKSSHFLHTLLILSTGLSSVWAGYEDQVPPPPQPNDISGTVNGCANAVLAHDDNGDGAIRRDEYLNFVNNVADLLCLPPRPILDLELQTVFVSIACLCQEREGNDISCCFGPEAGIFQEGAADLASRTEDEASYLRAACLLTQAVLGPEQCDLPVATIDPGAIPIAFPQVPVVVLPAEPDDGDNDLLWLLLLLLIPLICCICCCCYRKDKEAQEEYEITVTEQKIVEGPDGPISDTGIPPQPEDVEQALSVPPAEPPATDKGIPPLPLAGDPSEPFSGGDEFDEGGNAPRPGPPMAAGAPGMGEMEDDEEDEENIGRKMGANPDDDDSEDGRRRFGGQGELPLPPAPEGVRLRHVEREPGTEAEYEYPERQINEFKYKREDSGQILPHEEIDSGVNIPTRPPREPVIMPNPSYRRQPIPEPVYIDPRKARKQMGLGDGAVWDELNNWEEEQEKTGMFAFVPGGRFVIGVLLCSSSKAAFSNTCVIFYFLNLLQVMWKRSTGSFTAP